MAFNVSYIFQAIDNFSAVAAKINTQMDSMKERSKKLTEEIDKLGNRIKDFGTSATLGLTLPIGAFGALALHAASSQEKISSQIKNIVGDVGKAKQLSEELQKLKTTSPIDTSSLDEAALRLLVMGTSVDKVAGIIERFSKIAAGSGESVENLVEIFSLAQSGPEGMSRAIMMLGRRIPILQELQKVIKEKLNMNLTTAEIRKMASEGKIDISVLEAAIKSMTEQGGRFFNALSGKSKTLSGSMQLLKNNFEEFLEGVGFAIAGSVDFTGSINAVTDALKGVTHFIEEFAKAHPTITRYVVIFGAILAAIGPVLIGLGSAVTAIAGIAKLLMFLSSPIGVVIGGVLALVAVLAFLYSQFEIVRKVVDFLIDTLDAFIQEFPILSQVVIFAAGAMIMLARAGMLSQVLPPIFAAVRAAMIALNVAFAANPMGVMVVAVAALVAGIGYLLDKFGLLDGVLTFIKDKALAVAEAFKQIFSFNFSGITETFSGIGSKISNFFGSSATQTTPLINSNLPLANNNTTESKSTVDINLKGNTGAIESVNSKTDGNTNLKLSQNMAYGGY